MKPFETQKIRNGILRRKKKQTLTIREKKTIITEYLSEDGKYHKMSFEMIAREEDISDSTIHRIMRKRMFQWIIDMRQKRIPLSGPFIKQKALRVNETYKVPNFKAKHSWFRHFTKKMKISLRKRVGHSDYADKDAAKH